MKLIMKTSAFFGFIFLVLLTACANDDAGNQQEQNTSARAPKAEIEAASGSEIELKTFRNENGSWGYDIVVNGRRYIHQPEIPAVTGRRGFDREAQARKIGEMVVDKIRKGIMPPSVSAEEVREVLQAEGGH